MGNFPHFETSAKEAIRVDQVFQQVAKLALQKEAEEVNDMYLIHIYFFFHFYYYFGCFYYYFGCFYYYFGCCYYCIVVVLLLLL
jgi:hypothetical protein